MNYYSGSHHKEFTMMDWLHKISANDQLMHERTDIHGGPPYFAVGPPPTAGL